jgi:hypothetical protein
VGCDTMWYQRFRVQDTLKMVAAASSEMSVFICQTERCHILGGGVNIKMLRLDWKESQLNSFDDTYCIIYNKPNIIKFAPDLKMKCANGQPTANSLYKGISWMPFKERTGQDITVKLLCYFHISLFEATTTPCFSQTMWHNSPPPPP